MKTNLRLFLGIPIPAETRAPIVALQEKVKGRLGGWRVVPSPNWHVTVHFLGEVESTKVPPLEKWLRSLTVPKLPMLAWCEWFAFPKPESATTAGLAAPSAAAWDRWVKELATGLTALGYRTEKRAFVPHLTLFRRREGLATTLPSEAPDFPFRPQKLCLYDSQLTPTGSVYTVRVEKSLIQGTKNLKAFKEI